MALSTPAALLDLKAECGIKVKQEQHDPPPTDKIQQSSRSITTVRLPTKSAVVAKPEDDEIVIEAAKPIGPPPIDHSSRIGVFGWTTIGPVHLPVILRGDEKFVSVKMFECKVVYGYFPDIFPNEIFSCTSIKSYFVTESEAKLLNDVNGNHCDYQFGYATFSTKDYVVRLKDAENLFNFLECCKSKLYGSSSTVPDRCGFFLNYKIPYVKKGSKKYVSLSTIYPEDRVPPVTSTEVISVWDLAYFRLLSFFAPVDLDKLEVNKPLCNIEDLECALGGVRFEEVGHWPDIRLSSKEEWSNYLRPRTYQWVSPTEPLDDASKKHLRKKEDLYTNSYLGFPQYLESGGVPRPAHMQSSASEKQTNLFPVSLDNFLSSPSSYSYPVNINHHFGHHHHIQTPSVLEYERYKKSHVTKTRSYPPPLVRLNGGPSAADLMPKSPLYSYLPGGASWYPDWPPDDPTSRTSLPSVVDTPENLSAASWRNHPSYELIHGPPPHYPTPPQSSPMSLLDAGAFTTTTSDLYAASTPRLTPSGLCSPPPSPEQHLVRWMSVDARSVLAVNIKGGGGGGLWAVPVSLVCHLFLGAGVSEQSCQIVLETVFGLHLYESTSLHQEAFAKYNLTVLPGSKLILLSDLKNCVYQLKVLLLEKDKVSDKQYELGAPMAKRWCSDLREC